MDTDFIRQGLLPALHKLLIFKTSIRIKMKGDCQVLMSCDFHIQPYQVYTEIFLRKMQYPVIVPVDGHRSDTGVRYWKDN